MRSRLLSGESRRGRTQNAAFFRFSEVFEGKFRCKWMTKFLKRLKEGHKRFLDFKNLKLLNKRVRARKQLQISNGNSIRAILLKR